jgi:hypothetical protein
VDEGAKQVTPFPAKKFCFSRQKNLHFPPKNRLYRQKTAFIGFIPN